MHEHNFMTKEIIISAFNADDYVAMWRYSIWNRNCDFNRLNCRIGRFYSAI
jgi:hypothetical protein